MTETCAVYSRLVPSTDGAGYWRCNDPASNIVTFPERRSKMMKGPFYVCSFHAGQLPDEGVIQIRPTEEKR